MISILFVQNLIYMKILIIDKRGQKYIRQLFGSKSKQIKIIYLNIMIVDLVEFFIILFRVYCLKELILNMYFRYRKIIKIV